MTVLFIEKILFYGVICILCCLCGVNAQQNVNDSCKVARTGAAGICRIINDCPIVIKELSEQHLEPVYCGYIDRKRIVCCPLPPSEQPTTTPKTIRAEDRISLKKCFEYQQFLNETLFVSIGFKEPVVEKKVFKCPISTLPLIVGGQNALPKEFPHTALIGYRDGKTKVWGCGGTLISEEYVLTAAHCLHDTRGLGYAQYVRLGELDLDSEVDDASPVDFNISERIQHPDYILPAKYNDIALIKLDRPATINQFIRPACLPELFSPRTAHGIASGFGSTRVRGPGSKQLRKVVLEVYSQQECNQTYVNDINRSLPKGIIDETQMCAGSHTERRDTCQGDSGGPFQTYHSLQCMYSIDGVTSSGKGCGRINTPGVYTRVYPYLDWIENIVWPEK